MPKKKIVQPQDKLPSSEQGSSAKQASFKVLLSLKNQTKEKEEVNPLIITTPGKRNTKSTYRIVKTDEKPRFPSPPQKNFLESTEKSSKADNKSIIKPPKPRTNAPKIDRTTVSPDNSKKAGKEESAGRRGPSPASSTTHKKTKNSPPKTSTKGNKKRSDSPKESEASEDEPEVVEEVVPKRGRGRPRIHKVDDDDSAPIKKPRGRKRKEAAKDSPTLISSESEEAEDEDDEDSEGDFNEEEIEDEIEEEENKKEVKTAKRSAKQAELDGKDKGERKRPGRPRKIPQVVQEISEDDDDYVPVEGEEEKKSLLQTKLARKLKEKAQHVENNLPRFPESNEDIEKAVLEAVNDFKTNYLEQQILELLAHKFENVDQTNVKNIFQNIEFNAKLKNALNESSSVIRSEEVHSILEEGVVKEKKRGRKKKEVIAAEAMKIEDDQGTSQRTKIEEDSKESQTSVQDAQIIKIEAPAPKKRGRPKKIVEEVHEEPNKTQTEGGDQAPMEIEKSDSIEKKNEVIEVAKNDSEIINKVEEGETGEVVVKRKRGRPPKPKVIELESDVLASEGNSFVTKQEETVVQKEHIIIQTPVKKSPDDSVTEIKVEHQSGGGQNVPKKRGRPKLKPDDPAKEESKEGNHETKKLEVEVPAAHVIESDKKARKTAEKSSYDSPIRKSFEKTLKEIILLSTPGAVLPEETTETAKPEKTEGEKPKRGRKPKPKPEILVIDSVEKETKTISRSMGEEPVAEGETEKTPKKKGRKPKPKVDEGAVKSSEEQEDNSPEESNNNDEKEIKKPIEIDLTSEKSTVQKSAKKEGEEKKRPGRPPKVQEPSSYGEKKDVVSTNLNNEFDSLKPAPKKKASEDQIALEAKQNPVIIPESETREQPGHIHASGGSQAGNITTTEKKRRHPGMDVTTEKWKDKLRGDLVKYLEAEREKSIKDKPQQQPAPKDTQQIAQKKDQAPQKPVAKNESAVEQKPVINQPSLIEIEDTPEKILIEDEKEYKIPKKSIVKNFNDPQTPPRKITMEEEESADKAITIKTTPKEAHDNSLDLHHENHKEEGISSIQSPGEYLNMETDPFLNSGLEAEIKKDWLKQDEMFADENSRGFGMETEHKKNENKDHENAGDFEPGKVKKLKIHDDHESAMLRSMGQNLGDEFIGDAPDGEYSISQFLN